MTRNKPRGGVVGRTENGNVRANVVIGADGFHGRVARALRPEFGPVGTRFCLIPEFPLGECRRGSKLPAGAMIP